MKKIFKATAFVALAAVAMSGCIKEVEPQMGYADSNQVAGAPNAFDNYLSAVTRSICGKFYFGYDRPFDLGLPGMMLARDAMGQDMVIDNSDWFSIWYQVDVQLGPRYMACQLPWTYYYAWIDNCNRVLSLAGEAPSDPKLRASAGIAYAMRAFFYMDLARMFQYTYVGNEQEGTVPIVTEKTSASDLSNNPRATNEKMWAFILEDLDKAEALIADYNRSDKYTPDLSVVYGMKARAYLTMENWPQAEHYAKLAQAGYSIMTEIEYLDRMTAFNTPNGSWMMGMTYLPTDDPILQNDADTNWGSQMYLEVSSNGYASQYGSPKRIDVHLYETIPSTDFRKKCFIDPALDEMSPEERTAALAAYSDYPQLIGEAAIASTSGAYGCLSLKFRAAGGEAGRSNGYLGMCGAVPIMRVEEMYLIEAEAAGMQAESRGIELLTKFAKTRDPQYTYNKNQSFRDNIWWQRRVEFWGEGLSMYDIKRFNKGIIRSYAGTNHPSGYRFNTDKVPYWMNFCIVQTETNFNYAISDYKEGGESTNMNNPTPSQPEGDSPEHVW